MIDVQAMELVWRGTATATVSDNPTPEQQEAKITAAVQKILSRFPPNRK
jgi:hypothetical protein